MSDISSNMNQVASANRIHIGFFGCRNAGKSSVVNAVTGQDLAVVSDVAGTTTDPVTKAMELLPLGPVVIIDTPGFDDEGMLGELRVRKTKQTLNRTDIAVLVIDASRGPVQDDGILIDIFKEKMIPYMVVLNKTDSLKPSDESSISDIVASLVGDDKVTIGGEQKEVPVVAVSAKTGEGIEELKNTIAVLVPEEDENHTFIGDTAKPGDTVVLVCPIDSAAPKGRLIMPQQMAVRGLLDIGSIAVVVRETELEQTLEKFGCLKDVDNGDNAEEPPVSLVITDSQAFKKVSEIVPDRSTAPPSGFSLLTLQY